PTTRSCRCQRRDRCPDRSPPSLRPRVFALPWPEVTMSTDPIDCRAVLRTLNFGQRIAEDERDYLARYFVETDQWRRMYSGEVDIVYGAKGSGKSALYFLLLDRSD